MITNDVDLIFPLDDIEEKPEQGTGSTTSISSIMPGQSKSIDSKEPTQEDKHIPGQSYTSKILIRDVARRMSGLSLAISASEKPQLSQAAKASQPARQEPIPEDVFDGLNFDDIMFGDGTNSSNSSKLLMVNSENNYTKKAPLSPAVKSVPITIEGDEDTQEVSPSQTWVSKVEVGSPPRRISLAAARFI